MRPAAYIVVAAVAGFIGGNVLQFPQALLNKSASGRVTL